MQDRLGYNCLDVPVRRYTVGCSLLSAEPRNYAVLFAELLADTIEFWFIPTVFIVAQLAAFCASGGGDGFFGLVTGGVVESLTLDTGGLVSK